MLSQIKWYIWDLLQKRYYFMSYKGLEKRITKYGEVLKTDTNLKNLNNFSRKFVGLSIIVTRRYKKNPWLRERLLKDEDDIYEKYLENKRRLKQSQQVES